MCISGDTTIIINNTLIIMLCGVSASIVHSTNIPLGKIYVMLLPFKCL